MSATNQSLKRTAAYEMQLAAGARMIEFAGWELPLQYSGIVSEHQAVRERAGLFDVSHMGEIIVTGPEAAVALNHLTCNDVARLLDNQAHYTAALNDHGGVIDDLIVYRLSRERFLVCVNAANIERVYQWFIERNRYQAAFENASEQFGQLALQGPASLQIAAKLADSRQFSSLAPFQFATVDLVGVPVVIARTGYTGESGFELFVPWQQLAQLWQALLQVGQEFGLVPAGLGARDTLRLEACYPLHGHELSEEISVLESGLAWIVKFGKGEFIGRTALLRQNEQGIARELIALVISDSGIARYGDTVLNRSGATIGRITSGTKTPTLNKAIALALIEKGESEIGSDLFVQVRGRLLAAKRVVKPFLNSRKS